MTMELTQLRNIIEGALLAAGQPLNLNKLKSLFEEEEEPEKEDLLAALEAIAADCEGRGFELKEVGSGWRFQVRTDFAPWINRLWEERPQKYSRALLETLALVAYRQPITRGDIEEIRGVAVSSHIIKTLTEREWVKVVGHRDVPGRPALYATTRQFLDYFNLKSLEELPSLGEIRDLSDINNALDLNNEIGARDPDAEAGYWGDSASPDEPAEALEPGETQAEENTPSGDKPVESQEEQAPLAPDDLEGAPEADSTVTAQDSEDHTQASDDDQDAGSQDTESDKSSL